MNSKIIMIFIVFFMVQNSHAGKATIPLELLALFCTKFECDTKEGNHAINKALINGKDGDELNVPVGIDNKDGAGESTNANKTHGNFTMYDILFSKKDDHSTKDDTSTDNESETSEPSDIRYRCFTNKGYEEAEDEKTGPGQAALFSISGINITQIFINIPKAKEKYKENNDNPLDSSDFINVLKNITEMTLDRECTIEKVDEEKITKETIEIPEIPEIPEMKGE